MAPAREKAGVSYFWGQKSFDNGVLALYTREC
jgi:hypothetical protein